MSKRSGIVNVTMVITEEKILSNIDKIQKLINPNSKKKIVQLEEDTYFKDLVEAIKSYLIEYPNKKNFPISVYNATYGLVELATSQFEDTTKKIEELIKQREENIALSKKLKEVVSEVEEHSENWKEQVENISDKFSDEIIDNLHILASCRSKTTTKYTECMKILSAKINNLESNLHIEIDMERLEDVSKALSYIGIEIADALKLIPTPEDHAEAIAEQNAVEEKAETIQEVTAKENTAAVTENQVVAEDKGIEELLEQQTIQEEKEQYTNETTFEAKPSIWQKIKNSKIARAATYIFRIKIRIELPSNALPEGRGE